MARVARRFIVRGRVQGVGFRVFAQRVARDLGLDGWVRNLPDGRSVEALAAGDEAALNVFARALREGPPGSYVAELLEEPGDAGIKVRGFRILA